MKWAGDVWVWLLSLVIEVGQGNEVGQLIWSARWSGRPSSTCCKAVALDLGAKGAQVVLVARRFWVLKWLRSGRLVDIGLGIGPKCDLIAICHKR